MLNIRVRGVAAQRGHLLHATAGSDEEALRMSGALKKDCSIVSPHFCNNTATRLLPQVRINAYHETGLAASNAPDIQGSGHEKWISSSPLYT